jgi:magnesium transporter
VPDTFTSDMRGGDAHDSLPGDDRSHDELAEALTRSGIPEQVRLIDAASVDDAVAAVRALATEHQRELLTHARPDRRDEIFAALPPDERARLLTGVARPEPWLGALAPDERDLTSRLLGYPPESVGRLMTPRFLALAADLRCDDALGLVRTCAPETDTVYSLPVTDDDDRFAGMVELRDLLEAPDDALVGSVLSRAGRTLDPMQDQEDAARMVLSTGALAVPVLAPDATVLGLVTVDDAMEILALEESEDISRASGAEPLGQPYLTASLIRLARSRALWLVVAAAAAALTVRVLEFFEAELQEVVALALFIPLLLGTGGNIGAQAATTVVRAMAVDDVGLTELPRVVWREVRVGLMLGALLAVLAALPVWLVYEARLAAVVSLTLVTLCAIATMGGAMMPLLVGRLGYDPAVVSAPFITTLVDASGLLVYFVYARTIFQL